MTPFCVWQIERSHSIFCLVQECKQNGAASSDVWLKSVREENNFNSQECKQILQLISILVASLASTDQENLSIHFQLLVLQILT
jgi:hypothetical protein